MIHRMPLLLNNLAINFINSQTNNFNFTIYGADKTTAKFLTHCTNIVKFVYATRPCLLLFRAISIEPDDRCSSKSKYYKTDHMQHARNTSLASAYYDAFRELLPCSGDLHDAFFTMNCSLQCTFSIRYKSITSRQEYTVVSQNFPDLFYNVPIPQKLCSPGNDGRFLRSKVQEGILKRAA